MVGPKSNMTSVRTAEGNLDTMTDARGEHHTTMEAETC